jgi:hypothetical protein
MNDADDQKRARDHLADLLALDSGLTAWEVDFIDSVSKWDGDLTPKQIKTIYKIYERRC